MNAAVAMSKDGGNIERQVAIYGTFDVLNYGDLLFPLLVRDRLNIAWEHFNAFSPRGGSLKWKDTVTARPIGEAIACRADLHVIGGGNIIHATSTPLSDYADAQFGARGSYAALWLGAGLIAAMSEGQLAWNAPGAPGAFSGGPVRSLIDEVLAASSLVTVRDQASAEFLAGPEQHRANVVPDTILDLASLWSAAELRPVAEQAFARRGMAVPERWMAFHVNSRYLDAGTQQQARQIEMLAQHMDALPVLIAIGPCHGDDVLAREVGDGLSLPILVVDQPDGLREIAGLIAHGVCYVGSSMHGMITALAYQKPAVAVARSRMVKFNGLLEQLGMPDRLAQSWAEALEKLPLLEPLMPSSLNSIANARQRIAEHWSHLRALLGSPVPEPQAHAMERLRHWMKQQAGDAQGWKTFQNVLPAVAIPSRP